MITRKDINKVLVSLGAPAGNLGFEYTIDAILINQEDGSLRNMMGTHKSIANIHGTTVVSVERAIRHQFETIEKKKSGPYVDIFGDTDHIKVKDGLCALYNYLAD